MNPVPRKHVLGAAWSIADAVASVDIEEEAREQLARDLGDRLAGLELFSQHVGQDMRDKFVLLASDPLVPCAGYTRRDTGEHVACPEGRVIRIAMHNSAEPEGRSRAWKPRAPYGDIRCVTCGSMEFAPGYQDNVLAREAAS